MSITNRPEFAALLCLWLATACASRAAASGDGLDTTRLATAVGGIAERARPGVLGIAVKDLASGQTWSWNGGRTFPMQSVFKLPLGAVVLSAMERGELALSDTVVLTPSDLSPPYSPISASFPLRSRYSIEELLIAAAGGSDNTAADVLMAKVGGPAAVTEWLESRGIRGIRVDRYEREFQLELNAMPAFRPEWAKDAAFLAALNAVPADARRKAAAAYLDDPRDTSTPLASVAFLEKLQRGELLSLASTARLLRIATSTTTGSRRIKAGIPAGATVAHKTGSARPDQAMTPAINDIGAVTLQNGRRILIAIYLAASTLPYAEAESLHSEITGAVMSALR